MKKMKILTRLGNKSLLPLFLCVGAALLIQGQSQTSMAAGSTKIDSFTVYTGTELTPATHVGKLSVDIYRDMGLYSMKVVAYDKRALTMVKVQVQIGSTWYPIQQANGMRTETSETPILASTGSPNAFLRPNMKVIPGSSQDLTLRGKESVFYGENVAGGGIVSAMAPTKVFTLINLQEALRLRATNGTIRVAVKLTNNEGGLGHAFSFSWKPEYFQGETEAMGGVRIWAAYETSAETLLRQMWYVYNADPFDSVAIPSALKPARQKMSYALAHDLFSMYTGDIQGTKVSFSGLADLIEKNGFYPIPYKLDDKRLSDALYQKTMPYYLREYLRLSFFNQRSVASGMVNEAGEAYSYKDYRTITVNEGEALSVAAMRFLTWGLEYSLRAGEQPGKTNVFQHNEATVVEWIKSENADNTRNYLSAAPSPVPASATDGQYAGIKHDLAFTKPAGAGTAYTAGNPIPYMAGGVDTPRSFNYKLYMQYLSRAKDYQGTSAKMVPLSTRAFSPVKRVPSPANIDTLKGDDFSIYTKTIRDASRLDGSYIVAGGAYKPFVPADSGKMAPLELMQGAGIDEKGFLPAALSMVPWFDKIYFSGNELPGKQALAYASFSKTLAPLSPLDDSAGLPALFNRVPISTDAVAKEYGVLRMGPEDIERTSVLVKDLADVRLGDIVITMDAVNRAKEGMEVGIVVKLAAATDVSVSAREAAIKVVHVAKRYRAVTLTALSDMRGGKGAGYQIRRLLVKENPASVEPGYKRTDAGYDVMDIEPTLLEARLLAPDAIEKVGLTEQLLKDRWIPNTGEYLKFKIALRLANAAGLEADIGTYMQKRGLRLVIGMVDRRTMPSSQFAAESNIIVNRGTGFEMVQASRDEMMNPSMMRLGWWYNGVSQTQDPVEYRYTSTSEGATPVTPSGAKAMNAGVAMDDRQIMMMMPGLSLGSPFGVSYKEMAGGGGYRMVTTDSGFELVFGIRPILDSIRPGDDILITVSIKNLRDEAVFTATVPATDYLAVYDKKLLWRANLYVQYLEQYGFTKEKDPKPIMKDWNDQYPWNAPADAAAEQTMKDAKKLPAWGLSDAGTAWVWGYNDWNMVGWNRATGSSPGGQMTAIRPWTRWSDNKPVTGNVAYGWGCWDSVGDFNAELSAQSSLIEECRKNTLPGGAVNPNFMPALAFVSGWMGGMTTAPGGLWGNYVFPGRRYQAATVKVPYGYYDYSTFEDNFPAIEGLQAQHTYHVESNPKVSVPGLTTFLAFAPAEHPLNALRITLPNDRDGAAGDPGVYDRDGAQTNVTSGIDCSGLGHRVSKYPGSSYAVATHNEKYGASHFSNTEVQPNTERTWQIHPGNWVLVAEKPEQEAQAERDQKLASLAVPGDLLVVGGHVVIVQDLQYAEGSEVITAYEQVKVIHSTQGGLQNPVWMVRKNTWADMDTGNQAKYQLRRYR